MRSIRRTSTLHLRTSAIGIIAGLVVAAAQPINAALMVTYVTGEAGGADVIFKVTLDPTIPGSAVPTIHITDPTYRLDGIDFVPGFGMTQVVVGAQGGTPGPGAITRYDLTTGSIIPIPFVPNASAVLGSPTSGAVPSTVLSHGGHIYYIENQFGFSAPLVGPPSDVHRIMRVSVGAPHTVEIVYDGPEVNFEGLEIVDGRLYFFAQDPDPMAVDKRALMSVPLGPMGLASGPAVVEISGLKEGDGPDPPNAPTTSDGSDELDFDLASGQLFGTNIINGELIIFDVGSSSGHIVDMSAALLPGGLHDGIRTDNDGHLIYTSLDGIIGAIDIAKILDTSLDPGVDPGDFRILYDATLAGTGYHFDDLTPMAPVPEPTSIALFCLTGLALVGFARKRRHH